MYLDLPSMPPDPADSYADEDEELEDNGSKDLKPTPPVSQNAEALDRLMSTAAFKHLIIHLSTKSTYRPLRPLRSQPGNPLRRPQREIINPNLSRLHILLTPQVDLYLEAHLEFRGIMRETVYSSKNFTAANDWGPFQQDGTVDWALVQAIGVVMSRC